MNSCSLYGASSIRTTYLSISSTFVKLTQVEELTPRAVLRRSLQYRQPAAAYLSHHSRFFADANDLALPFLRSTRHKVAQEVVCALVCADVAVDRTNALLSANRF